MSLAATHNEGTRRTDAAPARIGSAYWRFQAFGSLTGFVPKIVAIGNNSSIMDLLGSIYLLRSVRPELGLAVAYPIRQAHGSLARARRCLMQSRSATCRLPAAPGLGNPRSA